MKLLVIGGTRFLGRHLVEAALARGHQVTLFNRGRSAPGLFADVEQVQGDRDGDLALLHGRSWDAVMDTCGFLPRVVRLSARALREAVDRYLFVSSISVYADTAVAGQDETSPRAVLAAPDCEDIVQQYGALKAACEDEVTAVYGERAVIVRPGLIVGPFDPSGRFTYWVQRMARGGSVLAPPAPGYPVQFIDARDLAAWSLALLERAAGGIYNACGPAEPLRFGAFLDACRRALRSSADPIWVDAGFLSRHGVEPWTQLPLWAGDAARGMNAMRNARALAAGLSLRSLEATVVDTARWAAGVLLPSGIGLSCEREAELLRLWAQSCPR